MIAAWHRRVKAGEPSKTLSELLDILREHFGYTLSYAGLTKHVRDCLGYRARG